MEFKSQLPASKVVTDLTIGSLVMFRYDAKTANKLPFYDKCPLVLIVAEENEIFFGTNIHYYKPNERVGIVDYLREDLENGGSDYMGFLFGSAGFHKYLKSNVRSLFLEVAAEEWGKASLLPAEEFVRSLGGVEVPITGRSVY